MNGIIILIIILKVFKLLNWIVFTNNPLNLLRATDENNSNE